MPSAHPDRAASAAPASAPTLALGALIAAAVRDAVPRGREIAAPPPLDLAELPATAADLDYAGLVRLILAVLREHVRMRNTEHPDNTRLASRRAAREADGTGTGAGKVLRGGADADIRGVTVTRTAG